jgi:hypothetical protein
LKISNSQPSDRPPPAEVAKADSTKTPM